jgi:hypothetical protein
MNEKDREMQEVSKKRSILLQGADDDEDIEEDHDVEMQMAPAAASSTYYSSSANNSSALLTQIVSPSPFHHHNDVATADRYRSALIRVNANPSSDVEAWEAIMNECMSLYRTQLLPLLGLERNKHKEIFQSNPSSTNLVISRDSELEQKLDWVESCHGNLLKFFPYGVNYIITAVETLLARSALPFESLAGGEDDFSYGGIVNWYSGMAESQRLASSKIDVIFEAALGVQMDGSPKPISISMGIEQKSTSDDDNVKTDDDKEEDTERLEVMETLAGMCSSSIELWLLYIRKRTRDAKREALLHHSTQSVDPMNPSQPLIKLTQEGEELIRSWVTGAYETALTHGAAFVYNNHLVWKQYLTYVKSWNIFGSSRPGEALAVIDHTLASKQKELLRSIYQRIITLPMLGLDGLWMEYEAFEKAQSEQLAAALIAENQPKYQHARSVYLERNRVYSIHDLKYGRLATPPIDYNFFDTDGVKKDIDEEEYTTKMKEECELLAKWKRRCGYERTNPERLLPTELAARIRQCYKDAICIFMRHVEVWHEWSSWELLNTGSNAGGDTLPLPMKSRNMQLAVGVLSIGEIHIPDSTLLAFAHCQILESQEINKRKNAVLSPGEKAISVMNDFCNRSGNTLGFVLLQRMVRKYRGIKEARATFATARRQLRVRTEDKIKVSRGEKIVHAVNEDDPSGTVNDESSTLLQDKVNGAIPRKMVRSRDEFNNEKDGNDLDAIQPSSSQSKIGHITWHLYASHANIEHRMNSSPKIAARIYEMGLRKHRTFLSTPEYVLQYCSLLLELHDEENLRALLARAISAFEEDNELDNDESDKKLVAMRRAAQKPLWDMMLKFETSFSSRNGNVKAVQSIEARRRKALYGPNYEDVSGANAIRESDVGIGAQKASLNETLIRTDGYDASSRIANGLDRLVDYLEISGILGQDAASSAMFILSSILPGSLWKDDGAGSLSDASFRRRKHFLEKMTSFEGFSFSTTATGTVASTSGRLSSAKERLAQSAAQLQNTSVMAAVQASPEWIRGMLMLLPATIRNYRGKAPPHLIEAALAQIRDNPLPATRPTDDNESTAKSNGDSNNKRMRSSEDGGESSDDEPLGLGYGSQFRARQKARILGSETDGN